MCGDPERKDGEWHSEDYSEPYSFQPPQSYPVCTTCHSRLHKRFAATPHEWELFCRHLEVGGYGREFVATYTREERQRLCHQLESGQDVSLVVIRPKEPGPHWWRTLTLDPESLEAPWARPRPLRPRPTTNAFEQAFIAAELTDVEVRLLRAHEGAPRRTAAMRFLSRAVLHTDRPQAANLIYGKLAARLTEWLDWIPDHRPDGSPIWMSLVAEGWSPPDREFEWTMVSSVAEAVGSHLPKSTTL